jgi:hypothetical protein
MGGKAVENNPSQNLGLAGLFFWAKTILFKKGHL